MKCLVTQLGEEINNPNLPILVDVSALVDEIVSKYNNVDTNIKEAFSSFIYSLVEANVYGKIKYMFLPCLSSSINECFYDAISMKSLSELGFLFDNKALLDFSNHGLTSKATSISDGACRAYFTPSSLALDGSFVGVSVNGSNRPTSDGSNQYIIALRTKSSNYDSIRFTSSVDIDNLYADVYPKNDQMSSTGVKKDGAVVSKNSNIANLTDGIIVETQSVLPSSYDISSIEFFALNVDQWGMSYTGLVYAYVIGSGTNIEENKIIAKALKQLSLDIRS